MRNELLSLMVSETCMTTDANWEGFSRKSKGALTIKSPYSNNNMPESNKHKINTVTSDRKMYPLQTH